MSEQKEQDWNETEYAGLCASLMTQMHRASVEAKKQGLFEGEDSAATLVNQIAKEQLAKFSPEHKQIILEGLAMNMFIDALQKFQKWQKAQEEGGKHPLQVLMDAIAKAVNEGEGGELKIEIEPVAEAESAIKPRGMKPKGF